MPARFARKLHHVVRCSVPFSGCLPTRGASCCKQCATKGKPHTNIAHEEWLRKAILSSRGQLKWALKLLGKIKQLSGLSLDGIVYWRAKSTFTGRGRADELWRSKHNKFWSKASFLFLHARFASQTVENEMRVLGKATADLLFSRENWFSRENEVPLVWFSGSARRKYFFRNFAKNFSISTTYHDCNLEKLDKSNKFAE